MPMLGLRKIFAGRRESPRAVLIHYHIFKNAGTTVEYALAENFHDRFARLDSPDPFSLLKQEELLEYLRRNPAVRAISSHNVVPPRPKLPAFIFCDLVLVRHPVDRFLSMYNHYRRADANPDPLSEAAGQCSLREFLVFLIERYPHLINNAQVNYLNGGQRIARDPDLKRAVKIAKEFSVLGDTESLDTCMVSAEHALRPYFGALNLSFLPQNVTVGRAPDLGNRLEQIREQCGAQFYDRLLKLNKLDLQLMEAVAEEARLRFEQIPNRQQRMQDFVKRCQQRVARTRRMPHPAMD